MLQKIKILLFSLSAALALAVPALVPATAYGLSTIQQQVCNGVNINTDTAATSDCAQGADTGSFQTTLTNIINIISIVVGVVAVIMIIFGGFKYITSGGTAEKVTGAKNTILYGLIGLIIVALAQVIVKFVLNQAAKSTG